LPKVLVDAATSTKLELNLYNVARASLEELKLDYQEIICDSTEKPCGSKMIYSISSLSNAA